MIERQPFGRTGHDSSRTLFGAAALGSMKQDRADRVLDVLLEYGVNHIDVAANYGDAELRVGEWMKTHRNRFFLATKTGDRSAGGARASIERSLERLQTDTIDLIQFHNLTDEAGWQEAFAPGGALEAATRARDEGLVRFIGVTGHGTHAPGMHRRSLERFPFDSVLFPYNYPMLRNPTYRQDVYDLLAACRDRGVAVQTIKSIARRRWARDATDPRYSWYEPIREASALSSAVHYVLRESGVFLNTSSDATLLPEVLKAAAEFDPSGDPDGHEETMQGHAARLQMAPLFEPGLDSP